MNPFNGFIENSGRKRKMKNYCPHCLTEIVGKVTEERIVERYFTRIHLGFMVDSELAEKVHNYIRKKEEKEE